MHGSPTKEPPRRQAPGGLGRAVPGRRRRRGETGSDVGLDHLCLVRARRGGARAPRRVCTQALSPTTSAADVTDIRDVRVQESYDFDLLYRFWSSHDHPVRASIVVDVDLG